MMQMELQLFGGRGASSSLPQAIPSGGGNGNVKATDRQPGMARTLNEALGEQGRPMSIERATRGTNPFFDERYGEYSLNCQRCVIANEARMRGYNVIALPTYPGDRMPDKYKFATNFKNARVIDIGSKSPQASQNAVEKQMRNYGDGSRAILQLYWQNGGGHVINVIQQNGKTRYVDGQIGRYYDGKKLFNKIKTGKSNVSIVRVDNLEFSNTARQSVRQNLNINK